MKEIKSKEGVSVPKHIAFTTEGTIAWARQNNISIDRAYAKKFEVINELILSQIRHGIPIATFSLITTNKAKWDKYPVALEKLADFFIELSKSKVIQKNQVKVTILGRWYDLPGKTVESIKQLIDSTKDYDRFFLNFCVNYSGKDEILDACKLLVRKAQANKINPESITLEDIKDNLYSSYFIPPDIVLRFGRKRKLANFLIWDSVDSRIYFPMKYFQDYSKKDFDHLVNAYSY